VRSPSDAALVPEYGEGWGMEADPAAGLPSPHRPRPPRRDGVAAEVGELAESGAGGQVGHVARFGIPVAFDQGPDEELEELD